MSDLYSGEGHCDILLTDAKETTDTNERGSNLSTFFGRKRATSQHHLNNVLRIHLFRLPLDPGAERLQARRV